MKKTLTLFDFLRLFWTFSYKRKVEEYLKCLKNVVLLLAYYFIYQHISVKKVGKVGKVARMYVQFEN